MSKESNQRKTDFLGMPIGTAQGKLRKMVMFDFIQKAGQDTCFQCDKKIETVDELSLEHKKPWLGESLRLYWDLENIAFSHLSCNSGAARNVTDRPKKPTEHGHLRTYQYGCRCDPCKAAKSIENKTRIR